MSEIARVGNSHLDRVRLSDAVDIEAQTLQLSHVQDVPPVKDPGRLVHFLVDLRKIKIAKLVPFRQDKHPVRTMGRLAARSSKSRCEDRRI